MSILIKNMEMPKNCEECPFFDDIYTRMDDDDTYRCDLIGGLSYWQYAGETEKDCPLIEVPPHGDLIEKNTIEKAINDACDECKDACIEFDGFFADCNQCIFQGVKKAFIDAPTIISAEEGE